MLKNAKWIKASENKNEACYSFYTEVKPKKKVEKAVLHITSMGMYAAFIDDVRVGNEIFTPYWTSYSKRLQYQTFDVTGYLSEKSILNIVCAEGWAVGYVRAGPEHRNHYADHISLLFSLCITYDDRTEEYIVSDDSVKVSTSNIVTSSLYDGEFVDGTASIAELGNAVIDNSVETKLIAQQGEKVIEHERINPVKLLVTPSGEKVIDFGQNFAGYVEITVKGKRGDRITISHAEILDSNGNFYTDNLRTAKQVNTYILSGNGVEVFKPTFTWQGFRYIRIDEYPFDDIDLSSFKGIAVYSDIKRIGNFVCGNSKINQLYHNIIWGQKSNFIDVPTDCPQRDERLGWTGDAQVFVKTAAINFDVEKFFEKWLSDLAADQMEDGGVSWLAPSCNLNYPENVSSAWGDAATICPWEIYMAYGNKKILKNQFGSMKKWVDYIHNFGEEEYLWIGGKQLGDWLAMDNKPGSYQGATSTDYISSAFFAYSTERLIKAGNILGENVNAYEELYKKIVNRFKERYIIEDLPVENTQTAYVLALKFGLCTNVKKTADALAEMIKENGTKLTTGFVGTPYLLHVLSENGYEKLAYDLLLQEGFPSWLYAVNHGATTMWEHWDGVREDGTFWDVDMNSYNHYAYGAVYDWIFGAAAGIKVLEDGAGYEHISIKPLTDKRLGFLKADIETRYGKVVSHWYYDNDVVHFEFEIPDGVTAEICLPDGSVNTVQAGSYMYIV